MTGPFSEKEAVKQQIATFVRACEALDAALREGEDRKIRRLTLAKARALAAIASWAEDQARAALGKDRKEAA